MRYSVCIGMVLLCLFSFYAATASPAGGVRGKVVEAGSDTPVGFAVVLLWAAGESNPVSYTQTGDDGSFEIAGIKDGSYTLEITQLGYENYKLADVVVAAASHRVDLGRIGIVPSGLNIDGVTVEARKSQIVYKIDKKVIDASANLMSGGGTAVDILSHTPSVRVDAEGQVTFRGSSGFAVYVDGKPSVFSGSQALEQIPAAQIENIELITTPSARHDTGGDVGIINIITKKQGRNGLSGMVNLTGSTALSRGMDFLLTQQNKASRWFVGGTWLDMIRKSDFNQAKTTIVADTTTLSHSDGPRKSDASHYSLKAGWAYTARKTTLSAEVEGGYAGTIRKGDLDYSEERRRDDALFGEGNYISRDDYDLHETYFQGTIGFDHRFNEDGHALTGSFYAKYGGDAMEYFQSDLFNHAGEREQGHRAWEDEHRWTVRGNLDYVLPYRPAGRIEAGYQYFSYLEDGDYSMQFWSPEKKEFYWRDDIYNTFYFQQGIHSVYALLGERFSKFVLQAGVRGEYTHRVLRSSQTWANRTFDRFDWFPSAHIGYHFSDAHILTVSYSRRTTRPELFFMEPYITYRDYYTAEIGNPDVRPEYINSFELNYKTDIGGNTVSATAFYRKRKDKIERLRVPYQAGVTLDSMANVGHDYAAGMELGSQVRATRWWHLNVNASVYYYKVQNEFKLAGQDETSTNYEIALNNSFDITKTTRIQFDGNFAGPSVTTQGRTDSFWYVNLAVRQQLWRRKVNATVSFRDVFNSARYVKTITTPMLQSITRIRPKYPVITLSLGFTFNNFKDKGGQRKETHDLFEGTNH